MTPTWYDVLNVETTATADEIRTAWRALVAELGPTDRRFGTLNQAAAILLDPEKRTAYDATLPAPDAVSDAESVDAPTAPETAEAPASDVLEESEAGEERPSAGEAVAASAAPASHILVHPAMLRALAAIAVSLVLVAAVFGIIRASQSDPVAKRTVPVMLTNVDGSALRVNAATREEPDVAAAMAALNVALPKVLSWDYRHLDATAAAPYSTACYQKVWLKAFNGIVKPNAARVKAVVVTRTPIDVGVVRVGDGRIELLAFIDQSTSTTGTSGTSHDRADVLLVNQGGKWLIDRITTVRDSKSFAPCS